MDESGAFLLLAIITGIPSSIIAFTLNSRRSRVLPESYSFWWGYFLSAQIASLGLVVAILGLLGTVGLLGPENNVTTGVPIVILGTICVICGGAGIGRYRWGWVAVTVLTINPVTWLIGYLYGRKRWGELRPRGIETFPSAIPNGEVDPPSVAKVGATQAETTGPRQPATAPAARSQGAIQGRGRRYTGWVVLLVVTSVAALFLSIWKYGVPIGPVVTVVFVPQSHSGTDPVEESVATFTVCNNHHRKALLEVRFDAESYPYGRSTGVPLRRPSRTNTPYLDQLISGFWSDVIIPSKSCKSISWTGQFDPRDSVDVSLVQVRWEGEPSGTYTYITK